MRTQQTPRQNMAETLNLAMNRSPSDWFVIPNHEARRFMNLLGTESEAGSQALVQVIQSQLNVAPKWATGSVRLYRTHDYLARWIETNLPAEAESPENAT